MSFRATRLTILQCTVASVALLFILGVRGDAESRALDLSRFEPRLDRAMARHVLLDDDPAFRAYCGQVGRSPILEAFAVLNVRLWHAPPDSYLATYRGLAPLLLRLGAATVPDGAPWSGEGIRARAGARGIELQRLMLSLWRLDEDLSTPIPEKIARYRELMGEFGRLDYEEGVLYSEDGLARMASRQGDYEQQTALIHSALSRARRLSLYALECQYLGQLGFHYRQTGNLDSTFACYQEGIAIADRQQLVDQSVRLRWFLAKTYAQLGRLAAAASLAEEAQSLCRSSGALLIEPRATLSAMDFFAELECWDLVRRYSYRMPVLLRAVERAGHSREFGLFSQRTLRLEAHLLAAEGRPDTAAEILSGLDGLLRANLPPLEYGAFTFERVYALLQAGRAREALDLADPGIVFTDSFRVDPVGVALAWARARARLDLCDFDLARRALHDARVRLAACPARVEFNPCALDAVDVGVELGLGHRREARRKLQQAMRDLRAKVGGMDAGPHSLLALAQAEDLHAIGHRLLENSASNSYRFELEWQSLAGLMGVGSAVATRSEALPTALQANGASSLHVVYGFIEGRLVRWTRGPSGIRREVLPITLPDCDRRVERAMRLLGSDPGSASAPTPDSLRAALSYLGAILLPAELRTLPRCRVVVSTQGSIARLPFEALDVSADAAYEPLIVRHDVVYARAEPPRPGRSGDGSAIILIGGGERAVDALVADPAPSVANREAALASAELPRAHVVRGPETTKEALLEAWSHASILYVAGHLARDPEAPLLCYFPMGFPVRERIDDAYLDLRDARATNLSGCDLAVLSSCASGEPYIASGRAGLSMADAMLDAGAAAVIHTRWRVRDDRAAVLGPSLSAIWLNARRDPVSAWCAERRTSLGGPDGWRHPFEWAAWSVTVRMPVQPWSVADGPSTVANAVPAPVARARPAGSGERSGSPH